MSQPYKALILFLGTALLLPLTSCAANSTPASSSIPSSVASAKNLTPSIASSSKTPTNQPVALLSPEQKAELAKLKLPVVVPTTLPADFKLAKLETGVEPYVSGNVYWYSLFYQGAKGTCLEIAMNADPAMRTSGLQQTDLNSPVGTVKVYSGDVEGKPMILGLASLPSNTGLMLRSGGWPPLGFPRGRCKPMDSNDYTKVVQSLQPLPRNE